MKPLTKEDLIPYEAYERERHAFRQRIIQLKARRRLAVGDHVTVVFENRQTIQFQVQEMVRVERIVDPRKVQEELDVYNDLLPGDGELSATLFIEITDSERIKEDLDRLQGIDRPQTVGLRAGSEIIYGAFEAGHSKHDKISAVHFVKFPVTTRFVEALSQPATPASVIIEHPAYRAEAPVPSTLREEWLADLGAHVGHRGTGASS